ncbi:MAG: NUDIX hydrolase [Rhodobacteraceae bacterium]|nr:NUDIX hydrolase [Paracoccaceae bacterium]
MTADVPIRDAATVIVVRDAGGPSPAVLMGQRGHAAAFMPSKFVFPGGAIDPQDAHVPLAGLPPAACQAQIARASSLGAAAVATAAIREVWEETGLILGQRGEWAAPNDDWTEFAATGHAPDASALRFVFRAVTPPGRPRRFDARFFLCDAGALSGNIDDFSRASDELSHLQWVPVAEARAFDLPFITEVVLSEIAARLPDLSAPEAVPFFNNDDEERLFQRLHG